MCECVCERERGCEGTPVWRGTPLWAPYWGPTAEGSRRPARKKVEEVPQNLHLTRFSFGLKLSPKAGEGCACASFHRHLSGDRDCVFRPNCTHTTSCLFSGELTRPNPRRWEARAASAPAPSPAAPRSERGVGVVLDTVKDTVKATADPFAATR